MFGVGFCAFPADVFVLAEKTSEPDSKNGGSAPSSGFSSVRILCVKNCFWRSRPVLWPLMSFYGSYVRSITTLYRNDCARRSYKMVECSLFTVHTFILRCKVNAMKVYTFQFFFR